jgi:acetyl esterase/lipase
MFRTALAEAGWRVIAWDHRGATDHAPYSQYADVRDALSVLGVITPDPVPVIAHSKGGGITLARQARPYVEAGRDAACPPEPHPDVSDHEQRRFTSKNLADWLDHWRNAAANFPSRAP